MPYGNQVLKVLDALKSIDIDMICPAHGLIWRKQEDIQKITALYRKWASHETENKAVIIYDSMWHSTEKMALTLNQMLDKENVSVARLNLQTTHISDAVTEILGAKIVLMGSPILNNQILPTMGALLTYLKGLKPKNRLAFTFGSYGWAKSGFKSFEDALKEAGMELISEGRYVQYIPDGDDLEGLKDIAIKIKNILKNNRSKHD
jgi:flavorubredoxin